MIRQALERGAQEAGLDITDKSLSSFELFIDQLRKWNRKVNLTAITGDDEIAAKHIIDSLFMARLVENNERVLDIGSGAGLPAIPLKIVKPDTDVVSVDAIAKKIHFQRHVSRLLQLKGFEALHSRIEELPKTRGGCFDVITSRAFSNLGQFASLAAPLLATGGRMIAMKGPAAVEEMTEAEAALKILNFEISTVFHYDLPFNCGTRRLIIISEAKAG
jgi:16S rRNA (guanine527-N7)-methyltransferase